MAGSQLVHRPSRLVPSLRRGRWISLGSRMDIYTRPERETRSDRRSRVRNPAFVSLGGSMEPELLPVGAPLRHLARTSPQSGRPTADRTRALGASVRIRSHLQRVVSGRIFGGERSFLLDSDFRSS